MRDMNVLIDGQGTAPSESCPWMAARWSMLRWMSDAMTSSTSAKRAGVSLS